MHKDFFAEDVYFKDLCERFRKDNYIDPQEFQNYNVKRGLRNADGTGVVAGITLVGNVHGFLINEGERVPIPGVLTYRGYDVNDLIGDFMSDGRPGFEETAYLLLVGELPNRETLAGFRRLLGSLRNLPDRFTEDMILKAPSNDVMNKLARATLALYSYDENPDDTGLDNSLRQAVQLIARFPAIVAHAYQTKKHYYDHESLVLHYPNPELSTAENVLAMIRPDGVYTEEEARLLDLCLVLHAEHGAGNNSAFACRVLTSAATDMYSSISAAVGSLKGPKHGGANIKVMQMFDDIKAHVRHWDSESEVADYLRKIIAGQAGDGSGLIYGMGHAIYTLSDPRAVALKKFARSLADEKGFMDEFNLIQKVEELTPSVFALGKKSAKSMCANVDLYSGMVYSMLGIPRELFTPIFAMSRIAGWVAHRIEETETGGRIIRPAYKPISEDKSYIFMCDREKEDKNPG